MNLKDFIHVNIEMNKDEDLAIILCGMFVIFCLHMTMDEVEEKLGDDYLNNLVDTVLNALKQELSKEYVSKMLKDE